MLFMCVYFNFDLNLCSIEIRIWKLKIIKKNYFWPIFVSDLSCFAFEIEFKSKQAKEMCHPLYLTNQLTEQLTICLLYILSLIFHLLFKSLKSWTMKSVSHTFFRSYISLASKAHFVKFYQELAIFCISKRWTIFFGAKSFKEKDFALGQLHPTSYRNT
jgi:hypothetical protein